MLVLVLCILSHISMTSLCFRGLLARAVITAQTASPTFTHVYAALVAILNTKVSIMMSHFRPPNLNDVT